MDGVNFIIFFAFLATIAVLIVGQVSMARGGKFDDDHSVELMGVRTLLQFLVFMLILISLFIV